MISSAWKVRSGPLGALVLATVAVHCSAPPKAPVVEDPGANCPDTKSGDAIKKDSFAEALHVDAKTGDQIRSSLRVATGLRTLAVSVQAELLLDCNHLAADLGGTSEGTDASTACATAVEEMNKLKAQLGSGAVVAVGIVPPRCTTLMDPMVNCSQGCEVTADGGAPEVKCKGGDISGHCDGRCVGKCEMSGEGDACDGECEGNCDAQVIGACNGRCKGKCDGKSTKAGGDTCNGKCEGKCEGDVRGQCMGTCTGRCTLKADVKCATICAGKCSTDFKAPRCSGEVEVASANDDCKAMCDAEVAPQLECTPAGVSIKIAGATDAAAAARYKAVLEKDLPPILKIASGIKERTLHVTEGLTGLLNVKRTAIKTSVSSDSPVQARLEACIFQGPFKDALSAAEALKDTLDVAVNVRKKVPGGG